ncbi:zinc ABC transporter substrate-binding protein [Halomonas sp. DP8Y7-1]|uniref:metal ABC transporter solute-binding protein, Zn/Mn family n=1 Tax=Halomonas sp. DP8Y7-1 TaxID=2859078 RepID=UPI001C979272|nr:zinc ABC transporter substrate-binding protein [Halomonas sp. DP8Y7-1]MBY6031400.1 zinc ABC transporter substrate-binding protein [Halomonas sp. DP8Y7-1]MED5295158.1 zinc ABC transporter substrate-binding protein [Pseudomonadota bacterium]
MRRSALLLPLLTATSLSSIGLAHAQDDTAGEVSPLATVVTIGMLSDLVEQVGGDCVAVNTMMGPGIDPHLYQASARDVHDLDEAELILYSGFSLEGQLGKVFERFSRIKPTAAVSEQAITDDQVIHTQDAYGVDPHLWMDAALWAQNIPTIAALLSEQRPDCAAAIDARAEAYQASLLALDEWIQASIDSIPADQRILLTAHDAFGYYGRAYGIEVAGIQGLSTATETGVADIRRMADKVVAQGVPAMFVESTINPRTVQAVIDAAADQGHRIAIGGQLYSDAMGDENTPEGTYIGMLKSNTEQIVAALGGHTVAWPDRLTDWTERVAQATQMPSEP